LNKRTKPTIMVVDDIPTNLNLLDEILDSAGYKTSMFPDGRLALKAAYQKKPDLILLDIMMPNMNGFEVCEQLKSKPGLADIPVLFMSALSDTNNKLEAFRHGAVDYVTKPFQEQELLARIDTHLRLKETENELKKHKAHLEELVAERSADLLQAYSIAKLGSWKYDLLDDSLTWSKLVSEIFEVPMNKPLGSGDFFLNVLEEDQEFVRRKWAEFISAEGKAKYEIEFRVRVNNTVKWVYTIAGFQCNERGERIKVIGTVKDITEKKLQLERLHKQNQTLRSIAWTQSHTLRAPLTRMMGLVEMAREGYMEDFTEEDFLNNLSTTADELDTIIRKIIRSTDELEMEVN